MLFSEWKKKGTRYTLRVPNITVNQARCRVFDHWVNLKVKDTILNLMFIKRKNKKITGQITELVSFGDHEFEISSFYEYPTFAIETLYAKGNIGTEILGPEAEKVKVQQSRPLAEVLKLIPGDAPIDDRPPKIEITEPPQLISGKSIVVQLASVITTVAGIASDDVKVERVTVNNRSVALNPPKGFQVEAAEGHRVEFRTSISLVKGQNTITFVATDSSGNQTTQTEVLTVADQIDTKTDETPPGASPPDRTGETVHEIGERWALLIGVDRYEKNEQGDYYLPDLTACVKDVKAIDAVLRPPDRGGFEHVTTLVSNDTPDESDDPTDRNILNGGAYISWGSRGITHRIADSPMRASDEVEN